METPKLLTTKLLHKWGHSYVVTLPFEVRQVLGAKAGDWLAFRKVGRYVIIAVEHAGSVIPLSETEKENARRLLGA